MSSRFAIAYLFMSGMLWVYTAWLIYSRRRLVRKGTRTTGVITAVNRDDTGDSTTYVPEFRFQDADGKACTVRSKIGAGRPHTFTVGQTVNVIFMPDHPESSASIDNLVQLYAAPVVMAAVATVSLFVGLIALGFLR